MVRGTICTPHGMSKVVNILRYIYSLIWTYHGTIDDLYLQIQIERMINATLVTPIHFTGFEKLEIFNGPEYLFYGSNYINYYRDVYENVISSYYKNIPDIKTCHDRVGDRIWKITLMPLTMRLLYERMNAARKRLAQDWKKIQRKIHF